MSAMPPAGNGTRSRIGLVGYVAGCASACAPSSRSPSVPSIASRKRIVLGICALGVCETSVMKRYLISAAVLAFASLPLGAGAQSASEAQTKVLQEIGECLSKGLPPDWRQA